MKTNSKKFAKGTFFSLLLAACTTFTACNNEESLPTQGNQLQLSFGVNAPESRAIHKDATLPDNSPVGVKLDGYADYANLVYKGTTTGGTQSWALTEGSVTLTDTKGTIYAYWPYSSTTSIDAIDVDMTAADQTDWLYATPVTGICEDKAEAAVTMNHAAANINVTINKGTYLGSGAISNITLQSDGIALGGTFNAAQATPDYTSTTDAGKPLSRTVSTTTGEATDIMVVPTGTSAAITFTATIDGIQFTATSAAVKLEKGNSYVYTLNLSDISTYMTVGSFGVTPWTSKTGGNLDLNKKDDLASGPAINSAGKPNDVYVVTKDGELVDKSTAAADALGVALITANQRILIEKNGEANTDIIKAAYEADAATNTGYKYFYWGSYGTDVNDIVNCSDATVAKADFNGKANTAAIIATPDTDDKTTYANMGTYCTKFNEMSGTYSDWYVPAAGQLHEIYTNVTDINAALEKIGGTKLDTSGSYWSSSGKSANLAWYVSFRDGSVYDYRKNDGNVVRFVRDIN